MTHTLVRCGLVHKLAPTSQGRCLIATILRFGHPFVHGVSNAHAYKYDAPENREHLRKLWLDFPLPSIVSTFTWFCPVWPILNFAIERSWRIRLIKNHSDLCIPNPYSGLLGALPPVRMKACYHCDRRFSKTEHLLRHQRSRK
jgi:hypothetical protein